MTATASIAAVAIKGVFARVEMGKRFIAASSGCVKYVLACSLRLNQSPAHGSCIKHIASQVFRAGIHRFRVGSGQVLQTGGKFCSHRFSRHRWPMAPAGGPDLSVSRCFHQIIVQPTFHCWRITSGT
jgi:hypothetical protein